MFSNIRTRAVWLAIGLMLGGSALAFAGTVDVSDPVKPPKPHKSAVTETTDDASEETTDAETAEVEGDAPHERKLNHGFYVSSAAHCENVAATETSEAFTAPEDCDTDGSAHGAYVRSVAKSDAGKKPKHEESTP